MAALSKKLRSMAGGEGAPLWRGIGFWCPGCGGTHVVTLNRTDGSPMWSWDGNVEAPTFSPSILVTGGDHDKSRCHSFVRAGKIEFLSDCTHALAGKTVDIPDWPYAEGEYGGV
jgi:hypothetical protein